MQVSSSKLLDWECRRLSEAEDYWLFFADSEAMWKEGYGIECVEHCNGKMAAETDLSVVYHDTFSRRNLRRKSRTYFVTCSIQKANDDGDIFNPVVFVPSD